MTTTHRIAVQSFNLVVADPSNKFVSFLEDEEIDYFWQTAARHTLVIVGIDVTAVEALESRASRLDMEWS